MADAAFMLDTNICIYALGGLSEVLKRRLVEQPSGALVISSVALAELAVGYGADAVAAPDLEAFLEEVQPLPFGAAAAKLSGMIPFKRGRFDRLIAAHALSLGLTLVTNNEADFANVPGLKVENWTI